MGTRSPRLAKLALKREFALLLMAIPILVALGGYYSGVVEFYKRWIVPIDPWNHGEPIGRLGLAFLLVAYTLVMALKQWGYYFGLTGAKLDAFFVNTAGVFNGAERGADILLSLGGGVLFLSAWSLPSFWLLCASLYSGLVFLRCWITLRRKKYAARWADLGVAGGPTFSTLWSTFPDPRIYEAAFAANLVRSSTDEWTNRLKVMECSLDWQHPGAVYKIGDSERTLRAKEVLASWCWSHRLHAIVAFAFFSASFVVVVGAHPGATAFSVTALLGGLHLSLFTALSGVSKLWGIQNWQDFVKP